MLIVLTTLLGTLSFLFRSRAVLELENLALRHQIGVLQRSARKPCKLTVPIENSISVKKGEVQEPWRANHPVWGSKIASLARKTGKVSASRAKGIAPA